MSKGTAGLDYGLSSDGDSGFRIRLDPGAQEVQLIERREGSDTHMETGTLRAPIMKHWHRIGVRVEEGIHRVTSNGEVVIVAYAKDWTGDGLGVFADAGSDLAISDVSVTE